MQEIGLKFALMDKSHRFVKTKKHENIFNGIRIGGYKLLWGGIG